MRDLTDKEWGKMRYGPLLGWAWMKGKKYYVPEGLEYIVPELNYDQKDWEMIATDGTEGVCDLCEQFGLHVGLPVPQCQWWSMVFFGWLFVVRVQDDPNH
jgi:hypothetical protein